MVRSMPGGVAGVRRRQRVGGGCGWRRVHTEGESVSLGLGMAMYDLMGKAAHVPVYKLFGQLLRRWVPVSR